MISQHISIVPIQLLATHQQTNDYRSIVKLITHYEKIVARVAKVKSFNPLLKAENIYSYNSKPSFFYNKLSFLYRRFNDLHQVLKLDNTEFVEAMNVRIHEVMDSGVLPKQNVSWTPTIDDYQIDMAYLAKKSSNPRVKTLLKSRHVF